MKKLDIYIPYIARLGADLYKGYKYPRAYKGPPALLKCPQNGENCEFKLDRKQFFCKNAN